MQQMIGQRANRTVPLFLIEREGAAHGTHQWAEAFCLMEYVSSDGREVEFVWNSRDGIAPYIIQSRLGTDLFHVRRYLDRYVPDFRPQPGARIIVDCSRERAERDAWRYAQKAWPQAHRLYRSMADLMEAHLLEWVPGAPLLVTVAAAMTPGSRRARGDGEAGDEEDEEPETALTERVMTYAPAP